MVGVGYCEDWLFKFGLDRKRGKLEQPFRAKALISTARQVTSISERLFEDVSKQLNMTKGTKRKPVGDLTCCISIAIHGDEGNSIILRKVLVVVHRQASEPAPVMIGVDVLRKCRFTMADRLMTLEG